MRTLNRDNISEFLYRREQLPERIRCLEEIATGRNISFLPLITGKDGTISQNKQTALVRKMLEALTVYRNSMHDTTPRSEKQMQLYRYFLYNAMMCLRCRPFSGYRDMYYYERWEFASCFSDLTDLAAQAGAWKTLHDLEEAELESLARAPGTPALSPGLFCSMDDSYQLVFGRHVAMLLPKARRDAHMNAVNEGMEADAEESWSMLEEDARRAGYDSARAYAAALAEAYEEDLTEEEIRAEEEYLAHAEEDRKAGEKAKKEFFRRIGDRKQWLQRYLRFRELYFSEDTDVTLLAGDIRDAVDAYLYIHKLSPFSFGDAYGLITNRLDHMTGQLRAEVKRARRYV